MAHQSLIAVKAHSHNRAILLHSEARAVRKDCAVIPYERRGSVRVPTTHLRNTYGSPAVENDYGKVEKESRQCPCDLSAMRVSGRPRSIVSPKALPSSGRLSVGCQQWRDVVQ